MKKLIFSLCVFFLGISVVHAAPVDVYVSRTTVTEGGSVIVTIKATDAVGRYNIGSSNPAVLSGGAEQGFKAPGEQATYTFYAKKPGYAVVTFTPINMASMSSESKYTAQTTIGINVVAARALSTNNNLGSLSVEGVELQEEFNAETLEYHVTLEPGTEKIVVNAAAADNYATVSGAGEIALEEGDNKIEITVTAENGATKIYTLIANVKEFNPIVVKIGDKEYTVVRNKKNLEPPANYKEKTVKINGEDVPAYKGLITKYTLVCLKDNKGNRNWYIKNKDNYTLYKEYKFGNTVLYPMELNKIPELYKKTSIEYKKDKIVAYKTKESSKYALIYAMNVETGKKNTYMYDSKEDTVQIYNDEVIKKLNKENNLYLKVLIGVSVGLFVALITIIVIAIKLKKTAH